MKTTVMAGILALTAPLTPLSPAPTTTALTAPAAPPVTALPITGLPITALPITARPVTGLPITALPAPTGVHPVGKTDLHLVDHGRADPWVAGRPRELMVSIWYPARKATGKPVRYLTPQESELLIRSEPRLDDVPADTLAKVPTHTRAGAPALRRKGGSPLVVLSPGMTLPRATMTSLAEEFASRGYVVAGIEHTYESLGTTFPDGRTVTFEAGKAGQTPETGAKVARVRAADTEFVLDRLDRSKHWNRLIDERRIAMVGHSVGGQSAAHLLPATTRIKAAVNLDGTYNPATPAKPLDKPFMMIGNPRHQPDSGGRDGSWDRFWPHVTGDGKRWLTVTGAEHLSFVDYAVLLPQLGLPRTPIDGERAIKITRTYVAAFLDLHLKGKRQPLLDKPSATYPEVRFW
ncbi:alpha/beta hydrolase [Nonomuraea glycinis]|uniref:Esterase n=1 Tax=Nonomuraea glycinis TaxID=2047744 RepID=A0A918EB59_9ACTN|nr:alpha/beta hydrolase [Nonomuraea glycinis]MCA2177590.1 alpha/beta hydrolase [Nonomuraea glycinis]GGP17548.1 esterase [Nonomuraea glycinis]